MEQLDRCSTVRQATKTREQPLLTATRESLHKATNTQHSQKEKRINLKKEGNVNVLDIYYKVILFGHNKRYTAICNNMDETGGHYAK